MKGMFSHSGFNGDISNWNVSNVTNMKAMFWRSKFNSDISNWNVSNVMDAQAMFMETEFNQDISNWHFNDNAIISDMFTACPIKNEYKPKMIRVNEAFDFHSVNKQKKQINAYDTIYPIIKKIIVNEINNISNDEYNQLTSYVGIYKPQNTEELKSIIKKFIDYFGDYCNLNWIDVSNITDMSYLFSGD
jgi:surface protein